MPGTNGRSTRDDVEGKRWDGAPEAGADARIGGQGGGWAGKAGKPAYASGPEADGAPVAGAGNGGAGDSPMRGYDDILGYMDKELARSGAEAGKRRRSLSAKAAVHGLHDLVSALGNIRSANRYAPSTYDPDRGLGRLYAARAEKARADYESNRDRMLTYRANIASALRSDEIAHGKYELDRMRAEARAEADRALANARERAADAKDKYYESLINKNKALEEKYYVDMVYSNEKVRLLKLGFDLEKAEAAARIRADNARAGWYDKQADGKTETETKVGAGGVTRTTTKTTTYGDAGDK